MKKTSTQIKKSSRLLLLVALLLTGTNQLLAYDFSVVNDDGQRIYYNITSPNTVEVTYSNYIGDTTSYVGDIIIPESVTYHDTVYNVTAIGVSAFDSCINLTSVSIPNTIISIKNRAFYSCIRLTIITIPDGMTSIGFQSFYKCTGLDSVSLGNRLATIGNQAFRGCYNISAITSFRKMAPAISENSFQDVNIGIPIYVRQNSVTIYKSANYWKNFINILPMNSGNVSIDNTLTQQRIVRGINGGVILLSAIEDRKVCIYNVQGNLVWHGTANQEQRIDVQNSGLYLVAIEGMPTQKVIVKK